MGKDRHAQMALDAIKADPNIGADFKAALPAAVEPKFVAIGCKVMQGMECLCVARSNTMARRIARALFLHTPNERGV